MKGREKKFQCKICEKKFVSEPGLKLHITCTHEGKKSITCEICNACFNGKAHLNRHILSIHEGKKNSNLTIVHS